MSEQLTLWDEDIEPDLIVESQEENISRCLDCGIVLDDPVLVQMQFCSSECERTESDDGRR
jgi:hypothetical protein